MAIIEIVLKYEKIKKIKIQIGGNMEENIILDENTLSPWLKKDLQKFLDCKNSNTHPNCDLSLYWSELYSSINISQLSKEITKEQAEYLRKKYLGICQSSFLIKVKKKNRFWIIFIF